MLKMKKADKIKILKRLSRKTFLNAKMITKIKQSKKIYNRKSKHK